MGPCKQIVGTPPFTAPEVINFQSVDTRTDLYSLGATAYYILTGRNAFPAKNFEHLLDLWRSTPAPPSNFIKDIPSELDRLVMSMIGLYRMSRPFSGVEVFEKLSAILQLPSTDPNLMPQIHLATPAMVGREEPALRVRKQMIRALRGRGGVVVIEGDPGVGRSRFLDACVLEGKVAGKTVLRADASDTKSGDYGVARALVRRLIRAVPEIALNCAEPFASILIHLLPELNKELINHGKKPGPVNPDNLRELRPRIQATLREWILKVSVKRPLMIAIDDLQRVDEPSVALLAMLGTKAASSRLVIILTIEPRADSPARQAIELLRESSSIIKLNNLSRIESENVLRSLFGETEHLPFLTDRLFERSKGNPRILLDLAQYLMDKQKIRLHNSRWILPDSLKDDDLPEGLKQIVDDRVVSLSAVARSLLEALSLCPDRAFSIKEYSVLIGYSDPTRVNRALGELVAAQLVSSYGNYFLFNHCGWIAAQSFALGKERACELHSRLAQIFQERGASELHASHHWLCAGEDQRALDVLVDFLERLLKLANTIGIEASSEFLHTLYCNRDVLERALDACRRVPRPVRDAYVLQRLLVSIGVYSASPDTRRYAVPVLKRLKHDCGLDIYYTLDESLNPKERLKRALSLARERYNATDEKERTFTTEEAIRGLVQHINEIVVFSVAVQDVELIESLPSLEPFFPIAAPLDVFQSVVDSARLNLLGQYEESYRRWLEAENQFRQYDSKSSEAKLIAAMRMSLVYALGLTEAALGLPHALSRAELLNREPLHKANAWRVRMSYYSYQRNRQQAEICRRRAEILQIQNRQNQLFEGVSLLVASTIYPEGENLEKVKETIARIETMAQMHKGWIPWLHRTRGEYYRIRGDLNRALEQFRTALELSDPERTSIWYFASASYINLLIRHGRIEEAVDIGRKTIAMSEAVGVGILSSMIKEPVAVAEALQGEYDIAIQRITHCIEQAKAMGIQGFNLGIAYEILAQIAIWMNDTKTFYSYAKLCADQYRTCESPEVLVRYNKLMDEARKANISVSRRLKRAAQSVTTSTTDIGINIELAFARCQGLQEIAQRGIDLLSKRSRAAHGYLYTLQKNGPVLTAAFNVQSKPFGLDRMIRDYLTAELAESDVATMTSADRLAETESVADWTCENGNRYRTLILGNHTGDGFVITGVAALCKKAGGELAINWDIVSALSNVLRKAGVVSTAQAAR